jgi:hypothetical protein
VTGHAQEARDILNVFAEAGAANQTINSDIAIAIATQAQTHALLAIEARLGQIADALAAKVLTA